MRDFTLGDEEYGTVDYLAWLTLGYKRAYADLLADIEIKDVFKPEYLDAIYAFRDEEIQLSELGGRMIDTLLADVGTITPKDCLHPEILDAMFNDPAHPLSQALADNDTYNWAPEAPTNLYYCEGDEQVTFENAILAEEVMRANGSTTVQSFRMDTDNNPFNHGECVIPASTAALEFFSMFQDITSSTSSYAPDKGVVVYFDGVQLHVDMTEASVPMAQFDVFDLAGNKMMQQFDVRGANSYDLDMLPAGMYIVTVYKDNQILNTTKLVKSL